MIQGANVIRIWEPTTGITLTGLVNGVTYRSTGLTTLAAAQSFSIETPSCRRTVSVSLTGNAFVNQNGCQSP